MKQTFTRFSLFILCTLFIAGCNSMFPALLVESDGHGQLAVSVFAASMPEGHRGIVRVELHTKENPGPSDEPRMYKESALDSLNEGLKFEQIGLGVWYVRVQLLDAARVPIYEGIGEGRVVEGETQHVDIALDPLPGGLVVTVDLGDECVYVSGTGDCLHDVKRLGQLQLSPGRKDEIDKHNFDWEAGERRKTLSRVVLPPRTYEFHIGFYDRSRIPSNIVFDGDRYTVDVRPGYDTKVTWHPETGSLHIGVVFAGSP